MSEMMSIAILRHTVIEGEDVFAGDKVKAPAAVARRLIALGKAEEVKRGRPKKKKQTDDVPADDAPADDAAGDDATADDAADDDAAADAPAEQPNMEQKDG